MVDFNSIEEERTFLGTNGMKKKMNNDLIHFIRTDGSKELVYHLLQLRFEFIILSLIRLLEGSLIGSWN